MGYASYLAAIVTRSTLFSVKLLEGRATCNLVYLFWRLNPEDIRFDQADRYGAAYERRYYDCTCTHALTAASESSALLLDVFLC